MIVIVFIGGIPSPAEGIGLENRQGLNGPRGSNPLPPPLELKSRLIDIKGKYLF